MRKMPHRCQGKAEALTSHLFPVGVGLEHVQKWSLMYFFYPRALLVQPEQKRVAASSYKTALSGVSYLAANARCVGLRCYPACSEKWEFWGHNSSHPKAAVQNRLSKAPLELRHRDDTWPQSSGQERGGSSTVPLIGAETSWEATSFICSLAISEQLLSLEAQCPFPAKPAQPISS